MGSNTPQQSRTQRAADSRARARQIQQDQIKREKRKRMAIVWGSVVATLVVIGVVVAFVLSNSAKDVPAAGQASGSANKQGGIVLTASDALAEPKEKLAKDVDADSVDVPENPPQEDPKTVPGAKKPGKDEPLHIIIYADFACVHCWEFEEQNAEAMKRWLDQGKVTVEYRLLNFLDSPGNKNYSARGANAAYCVAEKKPEAYNEFVSTLFGTFGDHQGQGLSDDEIEAEADKLGVDIGDCMDDGTYRPMVNYTTAKARAAEVRGTPTVFVGEENMKTEMPEGQSFEQWVESKLNS